MIFTRYYFDRSFDLTLAESPMFGSYHYKTHHRDSLLLSQEPEDHWSCIAHLSAEDMLKSAVIEEKKFKNNESK